MCVSTEQNRVCGKVFIINSMCTYFTEGTFFSITFGIKKNPKTNPLKKKKSVYYWKNKAFFQKSKSHKGSLLCADWQQQDTWYPGPVIRVNKTCWPDGNGLWPFKCVYVVCTFYILIHPSDCWWMNLSLSMSPDLCWPPPHNQSNQLSALVCGQLPPNSTPPLLTSKDTHQLHTHFIFPTSVWPHHLIGGLKGRLLCWKCAKKKRKYCINIHLVWMDKNKVS